MNDWNDLDDEELAAAAYVRRKRAAQGDKESERVALKMEAELKRRLGSTPSRYEPLEQLPAPRPWWKLW
jgi:hypothetical protein